MELFNILLGGKRRRLKLGNQFNNVIEKYENDT